MGRENFSRLSQEEVSQIVYVRAGHKPSSVSRIGHPLRANDHSSEGYGLPNTSCDQPGSLDGPPSKASLFGLAPGGVYQASPVTQGTGALLPHLFTLTLQDGAKPISQGGMFSVALSFALPRLRVTEHPALWSSDFPPALTTMSKTRAIVWPTLTYLLPTQWHRLSSK